MPDNEFLHDSSAYHRESIVDFRAFADGPFSAFVSPGRTLFVVQKVRVWRGDCYSSWWHSQGLRWRRSCSARSLLDSAKISYFFHNCNRLSRYSSWFCIQDIAVWKHFRKVRRSRCCSCRRSVPQTLGWTLFFLFFLLFFLTARIRDRTCWFSASGSSPEGRIPCACREWYARNSVIHETVTDFPRNVSNRSMVPKMILRLGFVDLVDQFASAIWVQPAVLSEASEPSGRAHLGFSYIPLSQCKLQVVCCGERLHVTVFGKIASLSLERASNCIKILNFQGVSPYNLSSGLWKWRTQIVFLSWGFFLLELIHFLSWNSIHLRFRRDGCTR